MNTSNASAVCARIDAIRKDDNMMGFERWREIGQIVTRDLNRRGQFFNTGQGLFFFDTDYGRAFPLDKDVGLAALINQRYGINPKEHGFGRVLAELQSEAFLNGRQIEIRRLAHYDQQSRLLYVSRFDGQIYRLDGVSVKLVPNGTDDVFFFDERLTWEPYVYMPNGPKGEFDRQLIESIHFADSALSTTEQQTLLKLWLLAVFFGSIQPTKIILLLLGDHGSGKTSALRRIQKFIFGCRADLLSIEKDKQDGFVATVTSDPLALFDNLDERIGWLPYALSRLATGVTFSRRQLYTTNGKVEFPGVSWLGITSRTVRFMENQPDLPDRTLALKVERLGRKRPEAELLLAIAQSRNAMWSELIDHLNAIVACLRQGAAPDSVNLRMADFASFALRVATMWGCRELAEEAFRKLEHAQADLVFEDEPVHQVLELWLATDANHGRSVDAGTLNREWSALAARNQISWPFANSKSLGQCLRQLLPALRQRFEVEVRPDAHKKQSRYQFWPQVIAEDHIPEREAAA
jgi:hypothetical protein